MSIWLQVALTVKAKAFRLKEENLFQRRRFLLCARCNGSMYQGEEARLKCMLSSQHFQVRKAFPAQI